MVALRKPNTKQATRELATFPISALGWDISLGRLFNKIDTIHILKAQPSISTKPESLARHQLASKLEAFLRAVDRNDLETVQSMLQDKETTRLCDTALLLASYNDNEEVFKFLLQTPANPNSKDHGGRTALHLAAVNGNIEIVRRLISVGVNVHTRDNKGQTALHLAVANGNIDMVEYLMSKSGNFDMRDNEGQTAFHLAV